MAIYHLHIKVIGRSQGKSAVASAAYRRAAKLFDERENKSWNYKNKPGVVHKEIIAPEVSPLWVTDLLKLHEQSPDLAAQNLWNLVEKSEKRIDAQLAREVEFSLPIELNKDQCIQLTQEFLKDQFAMRGMMADWSMHWEDGNPHVHVMLTMRELTQDGFGKKVTAWNNKALLCEWRAKWAEYTNFHLRLHQHTVQIDHRSYKDQKIDLIPTTHLGKAVTDMDRRGLSTDLMKEAKGIYKENLSRITGNPGIILDKLAKQQDTFTDVHLGNELGRYINDKGKFNQSLLTPDNITELFQKLEQHESVFSERDIAKVLSNFTDNAEEFTRAMIEVRASPLLLHLGAGEDGRDRYTTYKMLSLENDLQKYADALRDKRHIQIGDHSIKLALNRYEKQTGKKLTDEQLSAVTHITKGNSISCLVGRAGTGKSFSLGAARVIWEANKIRVIGVALSGIAADGLSKDAGIKARTIESFRFALEEGHLQLSRRDVIVMDEAGMTDSTAMNAVLKAAHGAKAKVVLVGDPDQLQPIGPGATFRALLERLGFSEIQTIYRQRESWQRDATANFAAGSIEQGLDQYEQHKNIHFAKSDDDAISLLVSDWGKTRHSFTNDLSQYLAIAHRNIDVGTLNHALRQNRIIQGEIHEGYSVSTAAGELMVSKGDRLLFLKNDSKLGVKNGRFGTVDKLVIGESGRILALNVKLDGANQEIIHINPQTYNNFTHGYAATVHKVQGVTVDHAFVYAGGGGWNRNLAYVAMSRHRDSCNLYVEKETHQNLQALVKSFSRFALKDSLLDYPLSFAYRRGIEITQSTTSLTKKFTEQLNKLKNEIVDRYEQWIDPVSYWDKKHNQINEQIQHENDQIRREDARHVAAYVDANREVGAAWQAVQEQINQSGIKKISLNVDAYKLLQESTKKRNAIAASLIKEPSRYERAFIRYSISLKKLEKQANTHSKLTAIIPNQNKYVILTDLLHEYVQCEIEQTKLITSMNANKITNPILSKDFALKASINNKKKETIGLQIINHPENHSGKILNKITPHINIQKLGGFSEIQKKLQENRGLTELANTLMMYIHQKIKNKSLVENEKRDRSR